MTGNGLKKKAINLTYICTRCFDNQKYPEQVSDCKRSIKRTGIKIKNAFLILKKAVQKRPFSFSVMIALAVATVALAVFSAFVPISLALAIGGIVLLNEIGLVYFTTKFFKNLRKAKDCLFSKAHPFKNIEKSKEICLVFQATHDKKSACYIHSEIRKLEKKYAIVMQPISDIFQMNFAIQKVHEQGYKIGCLWLLAHGNERGIYFGKGSVSQIDDDTLKYLHSFDALAPNAPIVLDACQTGNGEVNIAKKLSQHALGHPIIASKANLNGNDIKVESLNPLNFKARIPKWCLKSKNPVICLFARLFVAVMPQSIKNRLTESALVIYRDGVLVS